MSIDQEPSTKGEPAATKTILIVEDNVDIGEFLVQVLAEETSHAAVLVSRGSEALQAVLSLQPSLFILDYRLPDMDGVELYDKLHAIQGLGDVPALMWSAHLPEKELEKRMIVGVKKSIGLNELLEIIEKMLV